MIRSLRSVGSKFTWIGAILLILTGVIIILSAIGVSLGSWTGVVFDINGAVSLRNYLNFNLNEYVEAVISIVVGVTGIVVTGKGRNGEINVIGVGIINLLLGLLAGGVGGLCIVISGILFIVSPFCC